MDCSNNRSERARVHCVYFHRLFSLKASFTLLVDRLLLLPGYDLMVSKFHFSNVFVLTATTCLSPDPQLQLLTHPRTNIPETPQISLLSHI